MSTEPTPSILDRAATLGELADIESLRELCDRFQEIFYVGVAIFDIDGKTIVPPAVNPSNPGVAQDYEAAMDAFLAADPESRGTEVSELELHASGVRYLTLPIHNDLDPIGVAVCGPFQHKDGDAEGIPVVPPAESRRLGRFLGNTLDLIVYTSYKSFLTTRVHVESMEDSFRELEQKNRELRNSYETLKELDHMKSSFLSTVSHELRTPLTSIIGYSEMLRDGLAGELPALARKQIQIIVDKGDVLLTLINNLLDLSKIESGQMTVALDQISLKEVAAAAVETISPQAQKRKIVLSTDLPKSVDKIYADPNKLRQILVNLLSNAVKFTPLKGTVSLSATHSRIAETPGIEITVEDNGIGIPADKLERIFDHFYQVDDRTTKEHYGTGLGLPIVKSFVDLHGGTITATSREGKGTKMVVWLPAGPR